MLCYDTYDGALLCLLSFGPVRGQDVGDLVVGHAGQASRHIVQASQKVQPASAAAFDDGIKIALR